MRQYGKDVRERGNRFRIRLFTKLIQEACVLLQYAITGEQGASFTRSAV
jgi:hypothetical protein